MSRAELIAKLAEIFPHMKFKDVDLRVKIILTKLALTLAEGRRIEIRGFGSFELNYQKPRIARNPKTGTKLLIRGKYVPRFKPSKELRRRADLDNR